MTEPTQKRRQSDGGTYLIIADDSREFEIALSYAAHMAQLHHGHVAMARIIDSTDFMGWGKIENAAKAEARIIAEKELQAIADRVMEKTGIMPSYIIREGDVPTEITAIANGNPALSAIVLAASPDKKNAGPLINYFVSNGLPKISVPVILVPGHLDTGAIDKLR